MIIEPEAQEELLVAAEWLRTTTELPRGAAAGTQPLLGLGDLVGKKVSHYRVLEVIGGTARKLGIAPGDRVAHPMFGR